MRARWLVLAVLAACGGDDAGPPPPAAAPPPAGAKPPLTQADKDKILQPRMHAEERVECPVVEKPTGPECKVESPTCDPGLYCLPTAKAGLHCEPCPERDGIRHEFKDRDFVEADDMRDPFHSYIIIPPELVNHESKKEPLGPCTRPDQLVATNYSYLDLKIVGIVAQGTQRKGLMMDSSNIGNIVKRGDCVGKEKALVKDIRDDALTVVVNPEQPAKGPIRPPIEHTYELHPGGLQVPVSAPGPDASGPSGPMVAPPVAPPARP